MSRLSSISCNQFSGYINAVNLYSIGNCRPTLDRPRHAHFAFLQLNTSLIKVRKISLFIIMYYRIILMIFSRKFYLNVMQVMSIKMPVGGISMPKFMQLRTEN